MLGLWTYPLNVRTDAEFACWVRSQTCAVIVLKCFPPTDPALHSPLLVPYIAHPTTHISQTRHHAKFEWHGNANLLLHQGGSHPPYHTNMKNLSRVICLLCVQHVAAATIQCSMHERAASPQAPKSTKHAVTCVAIRFRRVVR